MDEWNTDVKMGMIMAERTAVLSICRDATNTIPQQPEATMMSFSQHATSPPATDSITPLSFISLTLLVLLCLA